MKWFGESWHAPVNMDCDRVDTPSGELCAWCVEDIAPDDRGIVYDNGPVEHLECFLRQIIGSAAHVLEQCSCFVQGATETDPPELSRREAAKLAMDLWEEENKP